MYALNTKKDGIIRPFSIAIFSYKIKSHIGKDTNMP